MIVDNGKYYLYRHVRLDKNEPFYIGVGKKLNHISKSCKSMYWRANSTANRNVIWNRIASKTEYAIEILLESNDREFIHKKESEFIKLYGRIDLGTGGLSNFTDGGEGLTNATEATFAKSRETKIKTGSFLRNKEHLKKYRLPKGGKADWVARKCFIYNSINGNLVNSFRSALEGSKEIGMPDATVNYLSRNDLKYKKWIFTYRNLGESVNPNDFKERKHLSNKIIQYSKDGTEIVKIWNTAVEASKFYGLSRSAVSKGIPVGTTVAGYKWGWFDSVLNKEIGVFFNKSWKSYKPVRKLDSYSGAIVAVYKNGAEAAREHNVSSVAISNAIIKKSKSCGFYWEFVK